MNSTILYNATFEGSRMVSGAITIAYCVSHGLTLGDIAILKYVHMLVVMCAEVPTGCLADLLGARLSLIVSSFLGCLGFILYAVGTSFTDFLGAECCIALCLSCWSGAYEAFAIDRLSREKTSRTLSQFFHANSSLSALATVCAGCSGALVAHYHATAPFWLSAVGFSGLAWALLRTPTVAPCQGASHSSSVISAVRRHMQMIQQTLQQRTITKIIGVTAITQIAMIPFIYYWQPWFTSFSSQPIDTRVLGIIFALFNGAIFFGSGIATRVRLRTQTQQYYAMGVLFAGFGVAAYLMTQGPLIWSVVMFCALEACFTIGGSLLRAQLNAQLASEIRATALSISSLVSKAGTGLFFIAIHQHLNGPTSLHTSIALLFSGVGIATIAVCGTVIAIYGGLALQKWRLSWRFSA